MRLRTDKPFELGNADSIIAPRLPGRKPASAIFRGYPTVNAVGLAPYTLGKLKAAKPGGVALGVTWPPWAPAAHGKRARRSGSKGDRALIRSSPCLDGG